ncbi:hypothetical protein GCM10023310_00970 [Paenibacillus vulneris]|uniref:YqbQ/XkdQ domain-containing protein n=1 Tax=Paenibacillus vulneris TaxID=1133364 RepID=A0ABW3UYZ3_9BACL
MLEIIIDNRDGYVWNVSGIVSEATYKTSRLGKASTFDFTFIKRGWYEAKEFKYDVGDIVRVTMDGRNVFYGYIFTIDSGRDEEVRITAYDQLRYLMSNGYLGDTNVTATEVVKKIASKYELKTGRLDDTKYKIPKIREDNVKLIDIICRALTDTLIATNNNFVLYDDFGELALRNVKDMVLDFSLGDTSLVFDYKQKRTIDNSYNQVILAQDNKKAGKREVYIYRDSDTIKKWGLLQYFQIVDDDMNKAQINELLSNLIHLKNRVGQSFSIDAIGDIRVRAGCYISINIAELGIDQYFLVDECVHKFDGAEHTMTLDLVDIRIGDKKV